MIDPNDKDTIDMLDGQPLGLSTPQRDVAILEMQLEQQAKEIEHLKVELALTVRQLAFSERLFESVINKIVNKE